MLGTRNGATLSTNYPQGYPTPLDPNLDAAALATLAETDASSWPAVLAHPNVYPELVVWIQSQTTQSSPAMPGSATAQTTAYPAAHQAAHQPMQYQQPGAPYQQYAQGSSQPSAADYVRDIATGPKAKPTPASNWPVYALAGLAGILLLSVFLPVAKVMGQSAGYFTPGLASVVRVGPGTAMFIILLSLVVLGTTVPLTFLIIEPLRMVAGIAGAASGLIVFLMLLAVQSKVSSAAAMADIGGLFSDDGWGSLIGDLLSDVGGLGSGGLGAPIGLGAGVVVGMVVSFLMVAAGILVAIIRPKPQPA